MSSAVEAIRKMQIFVDNLPIETCLTLPSIGIDFGSAFVRTAVVLQVHSAGADDGSQRISIDLTTFDIQNVDAALLHTKTVYASSSEDDETQSKLGVYYTGHASDERVKAIREAFPNAASVERRDKLVSHNKGVQVLINSNVNEQELYYEVSEETVQAKEKLRAMTQQFKPLLSPKMVEFIDMMNEKMQAHKGQNYPATLALVSSNFILCKLQHDATFSVVDVRCCAAKAMLSMWNLVKPSGSPDDFGSYLQTAAKGDRRKVDSITNDIVEAVGFYSSAPRDYPVFSFGKMERLSRDQVAPEDLARAILGFQSDLIISKLVDLAVMKDAYPTYLVGSLLQHACVREDLLLRLHVLPAPGLPNPRILKTDATAALGACCAL